jgi:hypothetical protein
MLSITECGYITKPITYCKRALIITCVGIFERWYSVLWYSVHCHKRALEVAEEHLNFKYPVRQRGLIAHSRDGLGKMAKVAPLARDFSTIGGLFVIQAYRWPSTTGQCARHFMQFCALHCVNFRHTLMHAPHYQCEILCTSTTGHEILCTFMRNIMHYQGNVHTPLCARYYTDTLICASYLHLQFWALC